jgi:hypothetical protein
MTLHGFAGIGELRSLVTGRPPRLWDAQMTAFLGKAEPELEAVAVGLGSRDATDRNEGLPWISGA